MADTTTAQPQVNNSTLGNALQTNMPALPNLGATPSATLSNKAQLQQRISDLSGMQNTAMQGYQQALSQGEQYQTQLGEAKAKYDTEVAAKARELQQADYDKLDQAREQMKHTQALAPKPENYQELGQLFSMISVLAIGMGRSGQFSAMNSLNAMSGMMKGYKEGNAYKFAQDEKAFHDNLAAARNTLQDAYEQLKIGQEKAKTDAAAAFAEDQQALAKLGSQVAANEYRTKGQQGLMNYIKTNLDLAQKAMDKVDALQQHQQDQAQRRQLAQMQIDASYGKEFKDVRGQQTALVQNYQMPASEVSKLGPKEVSFVAGNIDSAQLTSSLADDMAKDPAAGGVVMSFFNNFDKYLPSRYDNTDSSVAYNAINNVDMSGLSQDQVTDARRMLKKAVDVINARALAASGGSRTLVSELRMQKDVISPEGMSPQSAIAVYKDIAGRDLDKLKTRGISSAEIDRLKKNIISGGEQQSPGQPQVKSFATEAEAEAAAKQGLIKDGDKIKVGNQIGTWTK